MSIRGNYRQLEVAIIPVYRKYRTGVTRVWLRGSPVRTLSKNFPAIHQLDIHFWTEFLCTLYRQ
jgi:hypothetical protein